MASALTGSGSRTEPATDARHLPALDGIRGLAALVVVLAHVDLLMGIGAEPGGIRLLRGGFLGVDLFFVLSGCLITMLLVREHGERGRVAVGAFYLRRGLRLLPALAGVVALVLFLGIWSDAATGTSTVRTVAAVSLYVANWAHAQDPTSLGWLAHTWSLAVEEQFYLVWPPVLVVLLRRRVPTSQLVTLLLSLACLSALYRLAGERAGWGTAVYVHSPGRVEALALGCVVGVLLVRRSSSLRWAARPAVGLVAAAAVALVFGVVSDFQAWLHGGATAMALASALLVAHAAQPDAAGPVRRLFELAPLRLAGRTSYGLYLYHLPLVYGMAAARQPTGLPEVLVVLGLTVVLTTASFVLLERPALRLKRRWERVEVVPPVAGAPV